jgi:signal peptidase I
MNENEELQQLSEEEMPQKSSGSGIFASLFEWVETLTLYFAIAMAVLTLLFTHSPVVGSSMYPTLEQGDILIIRKLGYTPKNGDIIVCQSEVYGMDKPLVKRVIATGGQTVEIDYKTWTVKVDGVTLDEDYINYKPDVYMTRSDYLPDKFTVPDGKVFVMGDNRNDSWDSRLETVGLIDERNVLGKVSFRLLPLRKIGTP